MRWFSTVFTLESGSNAVAVKGETFLVAHGQRPHFLDVPDISQTLFRIFHNIFWWCYCCCCCWRWWCWWQERERGERRDGRSNKSLPKRLLVTSHPWSTYVRSSGEGMWHTFQKYIHSMLQKDGTRYQNRYIVYQTKVAHLPGKRVPAWQRRCEPSKDLITKLGTFAIFFLFFWRGSLRP